MHLRFRRERLINPVMWKSSSCDRLFWFYRTQTHVLEVLNSQIKPLSAPCQYIETGQKMNSHRVKDFREIQCCSAAPPSTPEYALWRAHCTWESWILLQMQDFCRTGCENWGSSVEFETEWISLEERVVEWSEGEKGGRGTYTSIWRSWSICVRIYCSASVIWNWCPATIICWGYSPSRSATAWIRRVLSLVVCWLAHWWDFSAPWGIESTRDLKEFTRIFTIQSRKVSTNKTLITQNHINVLNKSDRIVGYSDSLGLRLKFDGDQTIIRAPD